MAVVGNESLIQRAWNDLIDESATSIAILGRGGIGKTSLMKQLYNKLITTNHFENVIWITVSSKVTFQKIQTDIATNIGLFDANWAEKSSKQKSETIRAKMRGKKYVLFLDDLWFRLDLIALGVEGSKFIYSSRSTLMLMGDCSAVFTLKELPDEDAWQLFRSKVGNESLSKRRNMEIARNLVNICNGLPILISTLGRAMATRRSDEEWKDALRKIKRYRPPWKSYNEVNSIFKLCFDSLPNHKIKACLLYFSMFPEDFTIHKEDLIDFWICEQLFVDNDSRGTDAPSLGYNAICTLIEASFLEEEENDCVKLLDMIRDFALSSLIKSRMLKNSQLLESPADVHKYVSPFSCSYIHIETTGWISSIGNSIPNVPPNLLPFLLKYDPFIVIKRKPFSGMYDHFVRSFLYRFVKHTFKLYELTVLDLSNSGIEEVPLEVSRLVSLQYLNLSHTWIERLPIELKMLKKLKCLNLEYDDQLRFIPKELISSLLSLHVLKMFRCGYSVEELESNILSIRNIDINPLLSLEHLKVLSITITSTSALHKLSNNPKLWNCTQSLSLEVFWRSESLDITPLAVMKNLLKLEVQQAEHLKEFNGFYSELIWKKSFERLREVTLEKCSNLQELTWVILVPNLTILTVKSCQQIQEIISSRDLGEILAEEITTPFTKLEILSLDSLPELESVYWAALPFQSLKKMEIIDCSSLKKLPLNATISKADEVAIEAEEEWWKNVEWEDEASKTTFLPCFRQLL